MTPSSIRVTINGANLHDLSPDALLLDMRIEHQANEHSSCYIEYRQSPDQPFDLTKFQSEIIEVFAVLGDGTEFSIFQGWVEGARQKYFPSGAFHLQLFGNGYTIDLDQQNRFRTFNEGGFDQKFQKIVGDGMPLLSPNILANGSLSTYPRDYQLGETDWQHLLAECSDLGFMLVTDGDKLWAMDHFQSSSTTVDWSLESGLIEFEVRAEHRCRSRRGVNYDREAFTSKILRQIKDEPSRTGAMSDLCGHMASRTTSPECGQDVTTMTAESIAEDDLKLESRRALANTIRGIGESRQAALLVGRTVEIQGSTQFSGKWGVVRVVHKWVNSGYLNEFECTPFDTGVCVPAVSLPPFHGELRARVISAPVASTARIQVQFPWEEEEDSRYWPWVAPSAGSGRGICYPPEVGDEVLVRFYNGDASNAYIVAAAWNGLEPPPLEDLHGSEVRNNDIKRIVTKSGNRMVMDDKDGQETIVVATPNHVRVSLFDGGRTLVLHSDGDIHINAGGTVHMKCAQFLRQVG